MPCCQILANVPLKCSLFPHLCFSTFCPHVILSYTNLSLFISLQLSSTALLPCYFSVPMNPGCHAQSVWVWDGARVDYMVGLFFIIAMTTKILTADLFLCTHIYHQLYSHLCERFFLSLDLSSIPSFCLILLLPFWLWRTSVTLWRCHSAKIARRSLSSFTHNSWNCSVWSHHLAGGVKKKNQMLDKSEGWGEPNGIMWPSWDQSTDQAEQRWRRVCFFLEERTCSSAVTLRHNYSCRRLRRVFSYKCGCKTTWLIYNSEIA